MARDAVMVPSPFVATADYRPAAADEQKRRLIPSDIPGGTPG
jgi:hypothetical protein